MLYGVKTPAATPVGPKSWKPGAATQTSGTWTNASNGRVIDGSTTTTAFTGKTTTTRTLTLSGFATSPTSTIPSDATINSVSLKVAHRESKNRITGITARVTPGGASACNAQTVPGNVSSTTLDTDTLDVTSCLNTPAKITGGPSVAYAVTYACSASTSSCNQSTTAYLDGVQLDVTYTPAAPASPLNPQSGCVVKVPYYSPQDHSPGYSGASAVFKVENDANGGHSPRVAAFWGTVYTPSAALDVPVDKLTVPVFNRGVVARMLMLGYNVASDASVPITTTPLVGRPLNRRMILTASVTDESTQVVADVEVCDFGCNGIPVGGVKIWSWKVLR